MRENFRKEYLISVEYLENKYGEEYPDSMLPILLASSELDFDVNQMTNFLKCWYEEEWDKQCSIPFGMIAQWL
jgi:hypothetical protein